MDKQNEVFGKDYVRSLANKLIVICLIVLILVYSESVLLPIALATIFSLALITPTRFLEKKGFSRTWAAMVVTLLLFIIVTGVMIFISTQVLSFEKELPILQTKFLDLTKELESFIQRRHHVSYTVMEQNVASLFNKAIAEAPNLIGGIVGFFSNSLFVAGFTFFYIFLILIYRENINYFFGSFFGHIKGDYRAQIMDRTEFVIRNYITGLLLEMLFVAALLAIGFSIIGAKYAILLAVITAIMNVVPYLGFLAAMVLSVIITFATNSPEVALWVGAISIGVHLIDSNLFLPMVVGSKVSINALATVVGVFLGSLIWGIPGMFLAVPFVAVAKVVCDSIPSLHHWGVFLGERITVQPVSKVAEDDKPKAATD